MNDAENKGTREYVAVRSLMIVVALKESDRCLRRRLRSGTRDWLVERRIMVVVVSVLVGKREPREYECEARTR